MFVVIKVYMKGERDVFVNNKRRGTILRASENGSDAGSKT